MASKYQISTIFKGVDKITKPVRKMGGSISNFSLSAERSLRRVDMATSKVVKGFTDISIKAAKAGAGIATATLAGASLINKQAQETENMAKAMGANLNTIEAVSSAVAGIGLNSEHVTDLFEEMNNKFGESAGLEEILPVTESLAILGLEFEKIGRAHV